MREKKLNPSRPAKEVKSRSRAKQARSSLMAWSAALLLGAAFIWAYFNADQPPPARMIPTRPAPEPATSNTDSSQGTTAEAPRTAIPPADETPMSTSDQAAAAYARGDVAGAIELYEQALKEKPDEEDLHYNLGVAYAAQGKLDQAESHYREALRILPDYPEVHNNLGNLLAKQNKLDEAEKHFTEAIKIMPDYASAHNNLGIIRQRQGQMQEAFNCFEKAVLNDTNYWQARFNLANVCMAQGKTQQAVVEFKEVLRAKPDYEPAQRSLAKALGQSPPYAQ